MNTERARELLERIRNVRVVVYGDFCLDAYWTLDPDGSEISAETGIKGEAVTSQVYRLGAASNVVANLAALEPAGIAVVGVVGDDVFGRELARQLEALGVDTAGLVIQEQDYETVVYGKRYMEGTEIARVDFGMKKARNAETDTRLLDALRDAAGKADVVILNQQTPGSIPDTALIDEINALAAETPEKPFILDTRHFGDNFKGVCRKVNALEAAHLNGVELEWGTPVSLADLQRFAATLRARDGKPMFVTRGTYGMLVADESGIHEVPGIELLKKKDPVGAGDTALSALACCLAAGATPTEAATLANYAGTVTVQKLYRTGTASGPEILEVAGDHDYIYQPELAESSEDATYLEGTQIELCSDFDAVSCGHVSHALVDQDGTLSTLREGWESVMEPVMLEAILGDATADDALRAKVTERVRDYIDKSTGIQTILQMEALVEMVHEFGLVPPEKVIDKFGYKEIYNTALMDMVNERMDKLKHGKLGVEGYTINGAVAFMRELRERGVTLYLASGTDRDDVRVEAEALGYAALFNGGIHGSIGDVSKYSKKLVIDNILRENNLRGPELVTFGDGPVEIRECRKRGGVAVGLATDEVNGKGVNVDKRARLIKAGAHLVVPDFSEADALLGLLFR